VDGGVDVIDEGKVAATGKVSTGGFTGIACGVFRSDAWSATSCGHI
jgi:hypothetical protein